MPRISWPVVIRMQWWTGQVLFVGGIWRLYGPNRQVHQQVQGLCRECKVLILCSEESLERQMREERLRMARERLRVLDVNYLRGAFRTDVEFWNIRRRGELCQITGEILRLYSQFIN